MDALPVSYDPAYGDAISGIESGGRYGLLGPVTKRGDRAYGKYQVMGSNVGPWTKEILGVELTPKEFLADPKAQEAVFAGKFGQYVDRYGPEGAARAWFAGPGGMNNLNARDQLGTSVASYAQQFNRNLGQTSGMPASASALEGQAPQPPAQQAISAAMRAAPGGNWWEGDTVAGDQPKAVEPKAAEPKAAPASDNWWGSDPVANQPARTRITVYPKGGEPPGEAAPQEEPGFGATYKKMVADAIQQMREGAGQLGNINLTPPEPIAQDQTAPDWLKNTPSFWGMQPIGGTGQTEAMKGGLNLAQGAARLATSAVGYDPAVDYYVGRKVENATGIPKEYVDLAAQLATPYVGIPKSIFGFGKIPAAVPGVPSVEQLGKAASELYNSPAVKNFTAVPDVLPKWAGNTQRELFSQNLRAENAPATTALLEKAQTVPNVPGASPMVTGSDLDIVHQELGKIARGEVGAGGADSKAATLALNKFDTTVSNMPRADVLSGSPQALAQTLAEARGNAAAKIKAGNLDYQTNKVEFSTNPSALKNVAARIMTTPELSRGLSATEKAILTKVASGGSVSQKALTFVGPILKGIGLITGAVSSGTVGMAIYGAGKAGQMLASAMSAKDVAKVNELIRARSPLGRQIQASVAAWRKYADLFTQKRTPRVTALLAIRSKDLARNLQDAGITIDANSISGNQGQ